MKPVAERAETNEKKKLSSLNNEGKHPRACELEEARVKRQALGATQARRGDVPLGKPTYSNAATPRETSSGDFFPRME